MISSLSSLGWTTDRSSSFEPHAARGLVPGRVTALHRGQVELLTERGPLRAAVKGALQEGLLAPGVGDWVGVRAPDDPDILAMVEVVLPRTSQFVRKAAGRTSEPQLIAANVDVVLIATSLNTDLNPRRLERYLTAAVAGGARAVVLLTKADLVPDPAAVAATVPAAEVVWVSALTGDGLEGVRALGGPGATLALVGTSGVGKSTLVNALLGAELQDTGGIRLHDDRGKHTTTARTLFPLPGGGCLIDTPGMRELGLWAGEDALDQVYEDIVALAEGCAFRDCRHEGEPRCAVQAAVDRGELEQSRLEGLRKLEREATAEERRRSVQAERAHTRQWGRQVKKSQRLRRELTGKD